MPTVNFSKSLLLEFLGRKISDEQLVHSINYIGANVESLEGDEITIEIFPNRPDFLSEQGLARALKTFLSIKPGFKNYAVKKSNVKVIVDKSVKNVRPYTACAIVKGLKLNDEKIKAIIQIQEKLHITYGRNRKKAAIGIYPLEYIKPPIYYKALHPEEIKFKPLDMNKDLTGSQILAIHPTGREYGYLLEGMDKFPVFMDGKLNIMSMPPIINSNTVGKVTTQTKEVFIECSGFDFDYLHTCLNIIVTALADMGGEIYSVEIIYPDKKRVCPNLEGREMKISLEYVNKVLGLDLKEKDLKVLLEKMGIGYNAKKAIIPAYRADILHQIDLIEDIAIAYGYDSFESRITQIATTASENHLEVFKNKLREILIGQGLLEVKNYHLTNSEKQFRLMNFSGESICLNNSVNQEYDSLRYWLIPCLLGVLKDNKHYDYPQNIFEIGIVFRRNDSFETKVQEIEKMAIAFCGNDANFTKAKQSLDAIFESLDLKYELHETDHTSFIKGRVGRIVLNNKKIGTIGEIHPQVLLNWSLEMPVSVIELNVIDLFNTIYFSEEAEKTAGVQREIFKENVKEKVKGNKKTKKTLKKPILKKAKSRKK